MFTHLVRTCVHTLSSLVDSKSQQCGTWTSLNYHHLTSTSAQLPCLQLSGPEGDANHWSYSLRKLPGLTLSACGPSALFPSLISMPGCSWIDVKVEEGQSPTPCSALLSQEISGWISYPQTTSSSSSSLSLPPSLIFHLTRGKSLHVSEPSSVLDLLSPVSVAVFVVCFV